MNFIELQCPFCKQEQDFDEKLEHLLDCPNFGLHGRKLREEGIDWIKEQLGNYKEN